jgi:hypothetical protein
MDPPSLAELIASIPSGHSLEDYIVMKNPLNAGICLARRTRVISSCTKMILAKFEQKRARYESRLSVYDKQAATFAQWLALIKDQLPTLLPSVRRLTLGVCRRYAPQSDYYALRDFHRILYYTFNAPRSVVRGEFLIPDDPRLLRGHFPLSSSSPPHTIARQFYRTDSQYHMLVLR